MHRLPTRTKNTSKKCEQIGDFQLANSMKNYSFEMNRKEKITSHVRSSTSNPNQNVSEWINSMLMIIILNGILHSQEAANGLMSKPVS